MKKRIRRRQFLAGSLALGAAMVTDGEPSTRGGADASGQELYELRIYRNTDGAKQRVVLSFVETALLPALNRQGIDRVGIFTSDGEKDASIYMVIPYSSCDQLALQNDGLEKDDVFQKAAASYFELPKKDAAYTRIESRLLRAFAGMPVLSAPASESDTRMLELRIYESHNEKLAKLKVEMFNKGEIQIMRDVGMAPVFFGETLISNDVPNLTYMLSADSPAAHKDHWEAFLQHPEWDRMKKLERYKGTVSKIVSVMMTPTSASQI